MCNYCGCRAIEPIARLTAEHEQIAAVAGEARRAIERADLDLAATLLSRLAGLLAPHVAAEDAGVFAQLRHYEEYAGHVDALCAEHEVIHAGVAAGLDSADSRQRVLAALDVLWRHIDKEEHGLFPAAAVSLTGAEWEAVVAATDPVPAPTG